MKVSTKDTLYRFFLCQQIHYFLKICNIIHPLPDENFGNGVIKRLFEHKSNIPNYPISTKLDVL